MSDYHPDSWNPAWSVSTILTGLLSFMLEDTATTGSISTSVEEKRLLASQSHSWNLKNKAFCELFPDLLAVATSGSGSGAGDTASSDSILTRRTNITATTSTSAATASASLTSNELGKRKDQELSSSTSSITSANNNNNNPSSSSSLVHRIIHSLASHKSLILQATFITLFIYLFALKLMSRVNGS